MSVGKASGARRIVVGPFNRVEGDLEVSLDIVAGKVAAAFVNAPLYRGFEQILLGRPASDALVLVPRICGICSVSQSAAAAAALADLAGADAPPNGRRAANLILGTEVLADHLTHFYLFFMPDFARVDYCGRDWHADVAARFTAMKGSAAADFLPARARLLTVLGLLAGKWPHTLALRPGGTTRALTGGEPVRLRALLREFRAFLERHFFGDRLEAVAGLDSLAALHAWRAGQAETRGADWPRFLEIGFELGLDRLGRGSDLFLCVGAYRDESGHLFPAGLVEPQTGPAVAAFDSAAITEDLSSARLDGPAAALPPAAGLTRPNADKVGAYTWCKAPRYGGRVVETGALARQLVAGQPLVGELVAAAGGSVLARVLARGVEIARLTLAMEAWAGAIEVAAPYFGQVELPADGAGVGLVEAARGSLGHWLRVHDGRLSHYQIIAPTTWNFSPRDAVGTPGALEQALVGLPAEAGRKAPVAVQHIVRSFDPCMVCTVH